MAFIAAAAAAAVFLAARFIAFIAFIAFGILKIERLVLPANNLSWQAATIKNYYADNGNTHR